VAAGPVLGLDPGRRSRALRVRRRLSLRGVGSISAIPIRGQDSLSQSSLPEYVARRFSSIRLDLTDELRAS
jgi:hypothetical protein